MHTLPEPAPRATPPRCSPTSSSVARERGRTILVGESAWPYDAGPAGAGEPGPEFAPARGLRPGARRREADAAPCRSPTACSTSSRPRPRPHHDGYTLRSWVGPVPDDLLDGWARLISSLMTEAPTGDLDVEPEYGDAADRARARGPARGPGAHEVQHRGAGPGGELVAYTDLATTVHEPGRAYQWGTLVRGDARGHRLGLAVKVANLRLLQRERPDIRDADDLQRRGQRAHDRRQRPARLRAGRPARRVPEAL